MLLIISQSKRNARSVSDTFYFMSILSYGATPHEALSEISDLYRAALIINPESFPDINDFVSRIKIYKSDLPVFALTDSEPTSFFPDLFDGIFTKSSLTPALAERIISHANETNRARIGHYHLAGFDASSDLLGVKYFYSKIDLTKTEAMILRYLIRSYPIPQSPKSILKYAFRPSRAPEVTSIRTHISLMNKKISSVAGRKMIISLPHKGYMILTPEYSELQ